METGLVSLALDLSILRFSILDQIQLFYYPLHLVAPTCDVMQFIHMIVRVFLFPQAFFPSFQKLRTARSVGFMHIPRRSVVL